MNIAELISLLEQHDPDDEVRLMSQSSWPFEYSVVGTYTAAPQPDACGECGLPAADRAHQLDSDGEYFGHEYEPYDDDAFQPHGTKTDEEALGVTYIVEGTQLGYGTKRAWEEVERP